jgi:hypothetical protein
MTPQPERLIQPSLEVAVGRFHIPVLVRLSHIDPMAFEAIMLQQPLIPSRELLVAGEVVDRRRQAVAAHPLWHAPRQVQGVLKACGQGFKRLGMAQVDVLPIGIREDRMKQQMIVRPSANRDAQAIQVDEVKRDHVPRMMHLGKLDLLLNSVLEFPFLHPPFQRPSEGIADRPLARFGVVVFLLEPIQQRHRPESGIGFQKGLDLRPERFERIGSGAVRSGRPGLLAGERPLIPILANGSFSHVQCLGNPCHGLPLMKQTKHLSRLGVAEHRKPP